MVSDKRREINDFLHNFNGENFKTASFNFFKVLGYESSKRIDFKGNADAFFNTFDCSRLTENQKDLIQKCCSNIYVLFQLTGDELSQNGVLLSEGFNEKKIESYLFFGIELSSDEYNKTILSNITRYINKIFSMPVLILFKAGNKLTFSVIDRRGNKTDTTKDVLEKVSLIKDIDIKNPHRGHIDILYDLSLDKVRETKSITSWTDLHNAWQEILDISELNKKFYNEVSDWYFWAIQNVSFPDGIEKNEEVRNAISVIRLITRIVFVWFLREKGLIPTEIFEEKIIDIFKGDVEDESKYYKGIIQNLFFATLNKEMGQREFRAENNGSYYNKSYGVTNLYRYEKYFEDTSEIIDLFADIPFMNGGLFECLDDSIGDSRIRVDGFSDRGSNPLKVPDYLFFGDTKDINLSKEYGDKKKQKCKVRGLFRILEKYKFTIDENTPIDEEVALDPELLGRVFENLLASYNPETKTTARKGTGSYYTPRPIVDYMVDEAVIAYFETKLSNKEEGIRNLVKYIGEEVDFSEQEKDIIINAVDNLKIIDPACGSGAFPMGILQKMVYVLSKIDPNNEKWKEKQIERAKGLSYEVEEKVIEDIEIAFKNNFLDYGRKLHLIENCIFGVDIQQIATEISKLRFFVSLLVDQKINNELDNRGIRPLPNLETKFVTANSLLSLDKDDQFAFKDCRIDELEKKLFNCRDEYFKARTRDKKNKIKEKDKNIRDELYKILLEDKWDAEQAKKVADWSQSSLYPTSKKWWIFRKPI